MKKIFILAVSLILVSCVVGHRTEERNSLYQQNEICDTNPERCIDGVSW